MSFISGPKPPQPDPELVRQQNEARQRAERESAAEEARLSEDKKARERGLRGAKSLLSNNFVGFDDSEGPLGTA